MKNILFILPSYNIYGGTPKKTLDFAKYSDDNICVYSYSQDYYNLRPLFEEHCVALDDGNYGRNVFAHLIKLIKMVDNNDIRIVQSQFFMGDLLSYLLKKMRPKIKIVNAFVGPFPLTGAKKIVSNIIYKKSNACVYVSEYVKREKIAQHPILKNKLTKVIYNGVDNNYKDMELSSEDKKNNIKILCVSGLVDWKNISLLIETVHHIKTKFSLDVHLSVAGDGPLRETLEKSIKDFSLENNVSLLGYQSDINTLLNKADYYLHPAYAEGFGIAVAEAMHARKVVLVANAGALPELIQHGCDGFVLDPQNPIEWADLISELNSDPKLRDYVANNAKSKAKKIFSIESYISSYNKLYNKVLVS
ncbi:glycosyltransferase family 4 protein [Cobetia marina]|uniref:glycosyltransferase family 4 protein n=1 Tax=Cobetia marina TaxID=28258 RepID=UPI00174D0743